MKTKAIIQGVVGLALLYGGYRIWRTIRKNEDENTNFSGNNEILLAENNYPFGQYFKDPVGITVKSRPFYRRNKGTYKAS
jgi:hypothetical protein